MSTSNLHNTNALLLGTGEFSFAEGATTIAAARLAGFRDFGNMTTFSLAPENTKVEHKGSYRGTKRVDRTRVTESKLIYQLKLDEWTLQNMLYLFYGDKTTGFTQSIQSSVAADEIAFTVSAPAIPGYWYDITKSGVRVRFLTTLTWTGKTEGTDYVVDYDLGRIRFLAAVTDTFTCTFSAPAILATDAKSYKCLTPLMTTKRSGIGRLVVFDDNASNAVVLEHTDFGCDVSLTGNVEGGSDNFAEFTLEVLVTSPLGTVFGREVASGTVLA